MSLQEGALIEPLAVAVHITKQAVITPGQSVVVMGAGPVGLLCAAVARAYGATTVVSVDIVESKLEALGSLNVCCGMPKWYVGALFHDPGCSSTTIC